MDVFGTETPKFTLKGTSETKKGGQETVRWELPGGTSNKMYYGEKKGLPILIKTELYTDVKQRLNKYGFLVL